MVWRLIAITTDFCPAQDGLLWFWLKFKFGFMSTVELYHYFLKSWIKVACCLRELWVKRITVALPENVKVLMVFAVCSFRELGVVGMLNLFSVLSLEAFMQSLHWCLSPVIIQLWTEQQPIHHHTWDTQGGFKTLLSLPYCHFFRTAVIIFICIVWYVSEWCWSHSPIINCQVFELSSQT